MGRRVHVPNSNLCTVFDDHQLCNNTCVVLKVSIILIIVMNTSSQLELMRKVARKNLIPKKTVPLSRKPTI